MPFVPAPTATGLTRDLIRSLAEDEAAALAGWHAAIAGNDDGRPWWPWAIRAMPLETRLHLASDRLADETWRAREREYVIADPHYFINGYGHVQAPDGPPIPFRMWDEQHDVLDALVESAILVILKARQLGLTWIALHYAAWLLAFAQHVPRARILLLSKGLDEAKILLKRMRRILTLLPGFMRPRESQRTGDPGASVTELDLLGRGSVRSLPSSPKSARMETVTFALVDEAAFHQDFQSTWQSLLSTIGLTGQAAVVSTGNGPEEAPGEGQAYARLWRRSRTGDVEEVEGAGVRQMRGIFLPDSVHPDRTPEVRAAMRRGYLTDEDYFAEHPETEEQALMGRIEGKAYTPAGINAAERLGRLLDSELDAGTIMPPDGGFLIDGADYGEHTHHLIGWPLEGGGMYIAAEVVGGGAHGQSVRQVALNVCRALDDLQWITTHGSNAGLRWPLCRIGVYDAAGPTSNRSFREVIHSNAMLYPAKDYPDRTDLMANTRTLDVWDTHPSARGPRIKTRGMPFGGPAMGGRGRSLKQSMIDYARELLRRASDADANGTITATPDGEGVLAVSPRCPVFLRQLRGLETNDYGEIKKGDDHGPDAMLALLYPSAAAYHGVVLTDDDVQEAA